MTTWQLGLLIVVLLLAPLAAAAQPVDSSLNPSLFQQLVAWLQAAPPAVMVATVLIAPIFGVPLSGLLVILTLVFPLGLRY